ncbi:ATPase, T2SS/T4P/T4SS family, partial [Klebsiella pneumoniae]|uniref:ATPase, T2SS/T4P/T4SS family n=1 Tax=Klebsiella pneumoniae TaxID=573 RepID=UPI003C6D0939
MIPEDVLPALKQTLRMDPDTIYTGEIRGDEEARMTFQAADTGHRILASLHVTEP